MFEESVSESLQVVTASDSRHGNQVIKRLRFAEEDHKVLEDFKEKMTEEIKIFRSEGVITPSGIGEERRASVYFVSSGGGGLLSCLRQCQLNQNNNRWLLFICAFVLYNVYLLYAIFYGWNGDESATGVRLLVWVTFIVYAFLLYYSVLKRRVLRTLWRKLKILINVKNFYHSDRQPLYRLLTWSLIFSTIVGFLINDLGRLRKQTHWIFSLLGILLIIAFGYVFSINRNKIKWRPVIWGIFIQYMIGLLVVRWSIGQYVLQVIEAKIYAFLSFADYGTSAVYGYLVTGDIAYPNQGEYIFIYKNLCVIVFVSVVSSVLYHYGIMQEVIMKVGWLLEVTMGTTCCESMAAAANILLTMPEACLVIKPYMGVMTTSEMHAVLTSGFSTIAVNVFVAYVRIGVRADYLLVASVLSAPASLAFSKIFYPETEKSRTRVWNIVVYKGENKSCMEAIVTGAINAMALILKLSGNLIGFVSFIGFINFFPGWLGNLVGMDYLSAQWIMSKLFWPVAFMIGVEKDQCANVAWLIAVNFLFTNMAGYKILGDMKKAKKLTERSELLATYAICGFCNLTSIGLAFGTLASLVPERKSELSSIIMRAIVAGTCSCLMTACVVESGNTRNEFSMVLSKKPNMTSKTVRICNQLDVKEFNEEDIVDDNDCDSYHFDQGEARVHFEEPNVRDSFDGWVKSGERKASIYVVSNRPNRRKSIFQTKTCGTFLSYISLVRNYLQTKSEKNVKSVVYVLLFILYNGFLGYAISFNWGTTKNSQGVRLLVSITLSAYVIVLYYSACRKRILRPTLRKIKRAHKRASESNWYRILGRTCWVVLYTALIVFLIIDTEGNRIRLLSAAGVVFIIIFGYIFSKNRAQVKWRPVLWGVALQYVFGLLFIRSSWGRSVLEVIEYQITIFLGNTNYGTQALFAYLVTGDISDDGPKQHIFAFQTLTAIIFISIWMSVLYHYGVMQVVVLKIGWFLEMIMGTSVCESMAVASNIALSLPMACLTIKPYLDDMTLSELHVVMAAGFANVPGSVQGAYIQLGADAVDIISAALLSTCGAFAFAKLFYPETEKCKTKIWNIGVYKGECNSMMEAIVVGAIDGAMLLARICATLVAFGSFISFVNSIPTWLGSLVGMENLSLKWMLSKLFLPVAYIMGVESQDCSAIAWLVGVNLIFSNTSAFRILMDFQNKRMISHRSAVIATYSVCGYYTMSNLGLALGTLGSLIPQRRSELSAIVVRSLISGAAICFMTACVAGALISFTLTPNY